MRLVSPFRRDSIKQERIKRKRGKKNIFGLKSIVPVKLIEDDVTYAQKNATNTDTSPIGPWK